jgi:hypothetical protein
MEAATIGPPTSEIIEKAARPFIFLSGLALKKHVRPDTA